MSCSDLGDDALGSGHVCLGRTLQNTMDQAAEAGQGIFDLFFAAF